MRSRSSFVALTLLLSGSAPLASAQETAGLLSQPAPHLATPRASSPAIPPVQLDDGSPPSPWRVAVGVGFSTGVLPGSLTGHLTLQGRYRTGPVSWVASGWVSAEARQPVPTSIRGQASLRWLGGAVGVCPLAYEHAGGSVDGCALFAVGGVVGRGEALPSVSLGTSLFASTELTVRGAVRLHGPVHGWASVGGGPLLLRPEHTVVISDRETRVYRASPWLLHIESGLSFRL